MKLYGIKNCDTVRKARKWLDSHSIDYTYHDFREDGLTADKVSTWLQEAGVDTLLNKRSTTWKNLDAAQKQDLSPAAVTKLLTEHPTLIKRPVLENSGQLLVGFSEKNYLEFTK